METETEPNIATLPQPPAAPAPPPAAPEDPRRAELRDTEALLETVGQLREVVQTLEKTLAGLRTRCGRQLALAHADSETLAFRLACEGADLGRRVAALRTIVSDDKTEA